MFCKYCGKELSAQAIVCPGCGCLARDSMPIEEKSAVETAPTVEETSGQQLKRMEKKAKLFSMLAFIFLCVEAFFLAIHIVDALQYIFGMVDYHDEGGAVFAFLFAIAALAMGITAFVFGVKIKRQNVAMSTITVFVFVASIVAFIIPLVFAGV